MMALELMVHVKKMGKKEVEMKLGIHQNVMTCMVTRKTKGHMHMTRWTSIRDVKEETFLEWILCVTCVYSQFTVATIRGNWDFFL